MNTRDKLKEIRSLHSLIESFWLRIEWLDGALEEAKKSVEEAEGKHDEMVANGNQSRPGKDPKLGEEMGRRRRIVKVRYE